MDSVNNGRDKNGQFTEGNSGRPTGSENKITRKAKYLLNKYYDALKAAGIDGLVADSSASDKIRAILAGIPKNDTLEVKHSATDELLNIIKESYDRRKND